MSSPTPSIADLRKSYERAELNEDASHADPMQQFDQWLKEALAAQIPEPNAMTLATVDGEGRPHCRVLLLKGLDAQGFTFFTNYDSAKGEQLAARPFGAMTFFWPTLERQVRIEGRVEKVSAEESAAYYRVRPLGSRLGAWASPQSRVIDGRGELEQLLAETEQRAERLGKTWIEKIEIATTAPISAAPAVPAGSPSSTQPPSPGRSRACRQPPRQKCCLRQPANRSTASAYSVSAAVPGRWAPIARRSSSSRPIRCRSARW